MKGTERFLDLWESHLAQQSHVSCGAPAVTERCRHPQKESRLGWARTLGLEMCQAGLQGQPSAPPREEQRAPFPCMA